HPPHAAPLRPAVVPALRRLRGGAVHLPEPLPRRHLRRPRLPRALPRLAVPAPHDPPRALLPLAGVREQPPRGRGPLRDRRDPRGLAVLSGDVVNAADGWPVAEAAVGP